MAHSIGEAARLSGVGVEAIRWYEREGVIPPPARDGGGRRRYRAEEVARLAFIRRCRDLGFPLAEVRALLRLDGSAACGEAAEIGARRRAAIRARIADLQALDASLARLLAACDGTAGACPMLDALAAPLAAPPISGRTPTRSPGRPSG